MHLWGFFSRSEASCLFKSLRSKAQRPGSGTLHSAICYSWVRRALGTGRFLSPWFSSFGCFDPLGRDEFGNADKFRLRCAVSEVSKAKASSPYPPPPQDTYFIGHRGSSTLYSRYLGG